jgi:hypothetical protein
MRIISVKLVLLYTEIPLSVKYLGFLISTLEGEPNYILVIGLLVANIIPALLFLVSSVSILGQLVKSNIFVIGAPFNFNVVKVGNDTTLITPEVITPKEL